MSCELISDEDKVVSEFWKSGTSASDFYDRAMGVIGIMEGSMTWSSDVVAQENPIHSSRSVPVTEQVIADLRERARVGVAKYKVPLSTFNGRTAMVDAYQEALDLSQYLKQVLMESEERKGIDAVTIGDLRKLKDSLEGKSALHMASSGVINNFANSHGVTFEEAEWLSFVARTVL